MDAWVEQNAGVGILFLLGAFVLTAGVISLPRDLARPYLGGSFGVPFDVLLIICGVWMMTGGEL